MSSKRFFHNTLVKRFGPGNFVATLTRLNHGATFRFAHSKATGRRRLGPIWLSPAEVIPWCFPASSLWMEVFPLWGLPVLAWNCSPRCFSQPSSQVETNNDPFGWCSRRGKGKDCWDLLNLGVAKFAVLIACKWQANKTTQTPLIFAAQALPENLNLPPNCIHPST